QQPGCLVGGDGRQQGQAEGSADLLGRVENAGGCPVLEVGEALGGRDGAAHHHQADGRAHEEQPRQDCLPVAAGGKALGQPPGAAAEGDDPQGDDGPAGEPAAHPPPGQVGGGQDRCLLGQVGQAGGQGAEAAYVLQVDG